MNTSRRIQTSSLVAFLILLIFAPSGFAASRSAAAEPGAKPRRIEAAPAKGAPVGARTVRPSTPSTNLAQDPFVDTEEGGYYTYCIASSSAGQQCRDVVTIYKSGTLCATGCRTCGGVQYSASCACKADTMKLTGKCTYW